jgi:hypothetical protein
MILLREVILEVVILLGAMGFESLVLILIMGEIESQKLSGAILKLGFACSFHHHLHS